jgi:hypothetical protein
MRLIVLVNESISLARVIVSEMDSATLPMGFAIVSNSKKEMSASTTQPANPASLLIALTMGNTVLALANASTPPAPASTPSASHAPGNSPSTTAPPSAPPTATNASPSPNPATWTANGAPPSLAPSLKATASDPGPVLIENTEPATPPTPSLSLNALTIASIMVLALI